MLSERLEVRLPPYLMDVLRRRATEEERPVATVVRRALQRYLDVAATEGPKGYSRRAGAGREGA